MHLPYDLFFLIRSRLLTTTAQARYEPFVTQAIQTYDNWVRALGNDEWGDHVTLQAFVNVFQMPVWLLTAHGLQTVDPVGAAAVAVPLVLAYAEVHYQPVAFDRPPVGMHESRSLPLLTQTYRPGRSAALLNPSHSHLATCARPRQCP